MKAPNGKTGRISVVEALEILQPAYPPPDAAVRLTQATHTNKCRLWCDGNLLAPGYIARALKIVVDVEKDGRWQGDVVSGTRGLGEWWEPGQYRWELDAAEVKALLPQAQDKRKRGRPPKHPWSIICGEIAFRCIDPKTGRLSVPKNENRLAEDILNNWLPKQNLDSPSTGDMREAVKHICAALRRAQK
jgi:hypothetical protein